MNMRSPAYTMPAPPITVEANEAAVVAALVRERQADTLPQGRPGDYPEAFCGSLSGGWDGIAIDGVSVTTERGIARRLSAQGIIASRALINLFDDTIWTITAVFRRHVNPTDPAGGAVQFGIQWRNGAGTVIETTTVQQTALTVANGWQRVTRTIRRIAGAQTTAPAGAAYAQPFIRVFDADGQTDILILDQSVQSLPGPPGPVGPQGPAGPVGPQGPQGVKGDPGNYIGLSVNDFGDDISERPADPGVNNYIWGLRRDGFVTLYIWDDVDNEWSVLGEITAPEAFPVAGRIYVQKNGNDANSGSSLSTACLTIQGAIARAAALNLPTGQIYVCPGVYTKPTLDRFDPPDGWSIYCEPRSAMIVPAPGTEASNVFGLGNGTLIHGFTCSGFVHDDLDNPTTGFIAVFRPGAKIDRLPYVMNCVAFRPQPMELISDPVPPPGGGVLLVDAAVVDPNSTFKQAVGFAATGSSTNGVFYCAKNLGLIHLVSGVMIWGHTPFLALAGGKITLSGCETQFGKNSLVADGYGQSLRVARTPTDGNHTAAANLIDAAADDIVDDMWNHLVAEGLTTGWPPEAETFTRRDAANWLRAVSLGLRRGTFGPVHEFARGLYKVATTSDPWVSTIVPVFAPSYLPAFVESFEEMQRLIAALPGIAAASVTRAGLFADVLIEALQTPTFRKERSSITAIGHKWTQPGAGVHRGAIPARFGGSGAPTRIRRTIVQRRGGRVITSGQDDAGNAVFVGGLEIDARTGQLRGRPFDSAVEQRALEAAIAIGV